MNLPDNLNIHDHWHLFSHEFVNAGALVRITNEHEAIIEAYVQMHNWIGNPEYKTITTFGAGYKIPIRKMWALPDGGQVPLRSCSARECSMQTQIKDLEYEVKDLRHKLKQVEDERENLQDMIKKL
jgi:hypothetical protein